MMLLYEDEAPYESFKPLNDTLNSIMETIKIFNRICYSIYQFGNFITFLIFLLMRLHLFISARDIEYKEKLNVKNIEHIKKTFYIFQIFILWKTILIAILKIHQNLKIILKI